MASSSSVAPLKKYEVFISFRGEDTRHNFTSHLHAALRRSHVETYIDYRIEKGDVVWPELERAIKDSSLFLVVFSENYADSTWCLNELVEIMECHKKNGEHVIPVFYQTDPSNVRKQTGSYQAAFEKHKKGNHSEEEMQTWKGALKDAANISGFHCSPSRTESDLIEDIIKDVSRKLNHMYKNELGCLFIPDGNCSCIEASIKIDPKNVRIIGIWGMGGIGKTTLAAAIFHNVSSEYEGSCFLEKVTEESERHGTNYICNRLLTKLLRKNPDIDTTKVIPSDVKIRLKRMKVFVVLDDVKTSELLENLVVVGHDWLGAGSRVIVTTRDKNVLNERVDEIYEVKEMNSENSLRLFSLNAFNKINPKEGYEEISNEAIAYAKGIPLALKVLGSFLRSKCKNEWDSALTKLKKIPNQKIQKVLRLSYDELDDTEKNIFLDIAFVFRGFTRNSVTKILDACGFFAETGIRNLLDKTLITIGWENNIQMHDLIQEMGREIVREESPKIPGQRSRLCDPEEICDVLTNNSGTDAIEVICLEMTQIKRIDLSPIAFKKMPNLRILSFQAHHQHYTRFNSMNMPMGHELLSNNVRYFGWQSCPLKSPLSTFGLEKLVELSLPNSNVEKLWSEVQNLPSLERIDLSWSKSLMECPNLSGAPNLQCVRLRGCESLSQVNPSIFTLPKLVELDVLNCTSLKSLCSATCLPRLQQLVAYGCYNIQELWSGVQNLPSLETIDLSLSKSLMECPNLSGAPNLRHVSLSGCESLSQVDPSIFTLPKLETLDVSYCKSLKSLCIATSSPHLLILLAIGCSNIQELTLMPPSTNGHSTTDLYFERPGLNSELPSSTLHIGNLGGFSFPISEFLTDLPENFASEIILSDSRKDGLDNSITLRKVLSSSCFRYVRRLTFSLCLTIFELPDNISELSSLDFLALELSAVISLPESIKNLPRLRELIVVGCQMLRSIPALPQSIQSFRVWYCESLQNVLTSTSEPPKKHNDCIFMLQNCINLDRNSFNAIWKDAIDRIELGAKLMSVEALENTEDASCDDDDDVVKICYMLPSGNCEVGDLFHYHSTQASVTIELPRNHLGFFAYIVLFKDQSFDGTLECECGLESNWGERITINGFFYNDCDSHCLESDHVFLWYDAYFYTKIMEAIEIIKAKDRCTTQNPKLTLKFFALTKNKKEASIKGCGFRWIYPSKDQIVEEKEESYASKRCRETLRVEGSESDEQKETILPTKKLKQRVFGTPSNLEAEEMEDLRGLLEELLHIGFGGDHMVCLSQI